ncbi:hypothetical protein NFI96_002696, partial [Prochilodus magdalenae]
MRPALPAAAAAACVMKDLIGSSPQSTDGSELTGGQLFFEPGTEILLSCSKGYTPTGGSRKMVCKSSGKWTERTLKCSPKRCPVPDSPQNGQVHFHDITYKSNITFSCGEGFVLHGARSIQCLHTGRWSSLPPECKPVTCGLPDIPPHAKIVYDRPIKGNVTQFGFGGTYECRPPMVLVGNKRATCGANGFWTDPPRCRLVTCPVPTNIENGFLNFAEQREYGYKERVRYGCNEQFVLDGPAEVECDESGSWSRKPVCKAPCSVNIERGRISYNGQKIWVEKFKPKQVLHSEWIAVYCLNEAGKCGYPAPAQCVNGLLEIPSCYKVDPPSQCQFSVWSVDGAQCSCFRVSDFAGSVMKEPIVNISTSEWQLLELFKHCK